MSKKLDFNQDGKRIGENHPKAKLLDAEVELVLKLLDEGLGYQRVADKMGVSKSCIQRIANGTCRGQAVYRSKRVSITPGDAVACPACKKSKRGASPS